MSLTLITRSGNGAPLSAAQNDQNMNAIMTEVNSTESTVAALETSLGNCVTTANLNASFSGVSGGGQQLVDYSNLINVPAGIPAYPFRAVLSGSDQSLTVTGGLAFTSGININSTTFDPSSSFNTSTYTWTAPVSGYFLITTSTQVGLVSGSPTFISMIIDLNKNGGGYVQQTFDTASDTGTRIYRMTEMIFMNRNDTLTMAIQIQQTGDSVWSIAANPNTSLAGFLVLQTA